MSRARARKKEEGAITPCFLPLNDAKLRAFRVASLFRPNGCAQFTRFLPLHMHVGVCRSGPGCTAAHFKLLQLRDL